MGISDRLSGKCESLWTKFRWTEWVFLLHSGMVNMIVCLKAKHKLWVGSSDWLSVFGQSFNGLAGYSWYTLWWRIWESIYKQNINTGWEVVINWVSLDKVEMDSEWVFLIDSENMRVCLQTKHKHWVGSSDKLSVFGQSWNGLWVGISDRLWHG